MLSSELSAATQERDRDLVIDSSLKPLAQGAAAAKPAERWLLSGRILMRGQSPQFAFTEILGALASGVQFWPQLLRKKMMELQRVQRRGGMSCLKKEQ